jgi:hypothetical protein
MATENELTRLAGMAAALRPDWHPRSVRAVLAGRHRDRAFADLAVALAVICSDPATTTPGRLDEHGPWWTATRALMTSSTPDVGPAGRARCTKPGHEHQAAQGCPLCRAENLTDTPAERPAPPVPPPPGWRARVVDLRDRTDA